MKSTILATAGTRIRLASCASVVDKVEATAYTVERTYCSFEVRRHAPRVVAETTLPGPADQAGNQAFKVLASYIFGMSKGEQKIAMTGLVMRRRESWIEVGPAP